MKRTAGNQAPDLASTDRNRNKPRKTIMRKNLSIVLALLALIAVAPVLGACQTTAGAGQDISNGGNALTKSAEKHAP
jgi:predicted small secreted protein